MTTAFDKSAIDEFQSKSREGVEATMASFSAWANGWQAIVAECADYSKASFELSTKAFEDTLAAKSVDSAYQAQTEFARKAYDSFVGETGKIGEMYFATARDALAPIEKQMRKSA
jgi:hypothetical protein